MQSKKISNHTQMELIYNLEHQMTTAKVTKNSITQNYQYAYDPFGRRVSKTDSFATTYFSWDGNRLLSQSRGTKEQTYIYEQNGFVPVATLDQENNINYYHTDHLGTPQELTNTKGEIVWEAEYTTWGNTAKVTYKQVDATIQEEDKLEFQPLRFQGQYYDQETGLHYNRFRYYDPDGKPIIGSNANSLGIRPDIDKGMSGATDIESLPTHRKPASASGTQKNAEVFSIKDCDLKKCGLRGINDHDNHISIEPIKNMSESDFIKAINKTQTDWIKE